MGVVAADVVAADVVVGGVGRMGGDRVEPYVGSVVAALGHLKLPLPWHTQILRDNPPASIPSSRRRQEAVGLPIVWTVHACRSCHRTRHSSDGHNREVVHCHRYFAQMMESVRVSLD